jgi:hypothetical protein
MIDPLTIGTVAIPFVTKFVDRLMDKFLPSNPKARSAEEQIKLNASEVERINAVAKLDNSEGASTWVVNIRSLQRPIAVIIILGTWSVVALQGQIDKSVLENLASCCMFYLFGYLPTMSISLPRVKTK